jgi:hypothetical protein
MTLQLFRKPPVILKIVLKAGHECTLYTGENEPMREKESRNRNLLRLSEQSLKLVFSKKQTETLYLFISLTRQSKNLKTTCTCTRTKSVDLIYRPFLTVHTRQFSGLSSSLGIYQPSPPPFQRLVNAAATVTKPSS